MSAENETKACRIPEDHLTIEERKEKCRQLMETVVSMRSQYSKYIKKIDTRIAHEELRLLRRNLDQKIPADSSCKTTPESLFDDTLIEECRQLGKVDSKRSSELANQLSNLEKITEQINNDNIHRVTREPIDTKTIISRAKEHKMCTN